MIEILAYTIVAVLGVVMGLIGAGGSIMIVPVLVYLLGMDPARATGQSLLVVGLISLLGTLLAWRKGETEWRTAATFVATSLPMAFVGRALLLPLVPERVLGLPKSAALMLAFAALMILAARSMLARKGDVSPETKSVLFLGFVGMGVGLITGILGAGGGFVIVPALTLLAGVPMKRSVGTSLAIIAANSAMGFGAEAAQHTPDWRLLGTMTLIAAVGMVVGSEFRSRASAAGLRKGFGWFVLAVAAVIVFQEVAKIL